MLRAGDIAVSRPFFCAKRKSFLLGLVNTLLVARMLGDLWHWLFAVGFSGAYTTFSTFEFETSRLSSSWLALANLVGSVVAGYGAVWLGILLAETWLHGKILTFELWPLVGKP